MRLPAYIKYIAISALLIVSSVNFTRTTLDILNSSKRLEDMESEVNDLDERKSMLENSIEYKNTDDYIEERARNDLNLVKPGEKVYIVKDTGNTDGSSTKSQGNVLSDYTEKLSDNAELKGSNPYLWYRLFFQ